MIEIPDNVLEALTDCRESGQCNMFDRECVMNYCINNGLSRAAVWLYEHKRLYGQVLIEFGKLIKD